VVDLYRLKNRLRLLLPGGNFPWLTNFKDFDSYPKQILCMTAAGLGDTIMDAPAIHALKQKFPNAKLSVLVHYNRGGNEICRLMPSVDKTIDLGLKSYRWRHVIPFMLCNFWKLLYKLRKLDFDLVVIFWPNPVRRFLLAGIGSRYWIYGNLVDDYPGAQDFRLLKLVGVEKTAKNSVFQIPEPSDAERILPRSLPKPLIGVHPFCGLQWKEWKKFGQLQEQLLKLGGTVVTMGEKQGYQTSSAVHNLVNKTSIAQLFWVIKKCDVFVTADSGPMHIGFLVGTPTVALFGFAAPDFLVPPRGRERRTIIYKASSESKKIERVTERNKLDDSNMQSITVEEVVKETMQLLNDIGWNI